MPADGGPASLRDVYDAVDGTRQELGGKIDELAKEIRENNVAVSSRLTAVEIIQSGHTRTLEAHDSDIEALKAAKAESDGGHKVKAALAGAALTLGGGGLVALVSWLSHSFH